MAPSTLAPATGESRCGRGPWARSILCVVFLAALLSTSAWGSAQRPNIVILYTDDQGFGDVGYQNPNSKFETPHIDRLAREGIVFSDGHSPDTVCTPSRYGLLTGRYSWRTPLKRGVFGAERTCLIPDDRVTVASFLRSHGYRTAMVGKWHLGMDFPGEWGDRDWSQPVHDMPLDKGFDRFWGIPASMNYGVLAWLPGLAQEARLGRPFFLYLSLTSPHKPVIPTRPFRLSSRAGGYGDFMMETDWQVGRLLKALQDEGVSRDTLVFLSSDNGPENTWRERKRLYGHSSSGPYREGKRSVYEGGHRVPFVVRWPRRVRPGRVWKGPVNQTDLLATLAQMLGETLPEGAGEDSVSFYPILVDASARPRRPPMIHHSMQGRFAIREGRWKLIMETDTETRELYDLESDPGETRNLLRDHPEVEADLVRKISAIVSSGRSTPGAPAANDTPNWSDLTWMQVEGTNPPRPRQ